MIVLSNDGQLKPIRLYWLRDRALANDGGHKMIAYTVFCPNSARALHPLVTGETLTAIYFAG